MSNTTTCMHAIQSVSGISTSTVEKLYTNAGIEQPMRIIEKPIGYRHMGREITALDALVNASVAQKERNDHHVENYHIWGDVYVTYIWEK